MKKDYEECKGCDTTDMEIHDSHCMWNNKDSICPCGTCLVKIMCNTICDTLEEYRYKMNKSKEH